MARHQHAHEVLGLTVAFFAGNQDLVDVLVVEVAHRTLDQAAFLVDQGRGRGLQCQIADVFPKPHQIFVVALDLGLGAAFAGRAQDDAHALRHFEIGDDLLESLAVAGAGDLARNAAATRRVRHQHRIAAGKRQIGGEGRTLVAALFLDDLNEQDLAALDDFLDLVLTAHRFAAVAHFFECILGADRFDLVVVRMRGLHLFQHRRDHCRSKWLRHLSRWMWLRHLGRWMWLRHLGRWRWLRRWFCLRDGFGNHIRFDSCGDRRRPRLAKVRSHRDLRRAWPYLNRPHPIDVSAFSERSERLRLRHHSPVVAIFIRDHQRSAAPASRPCSPRSRFLPPRRRPRRPRLRLWRSSPSPSSSSSSSASAASARNSA